MQMRFVFGAACLGALALLTGAVQAAPHYANRFHQKYVPIANAHHQRYDLDVFARGTSTYSSTVRSSTYTH